MANKYFKISSALKSLIGSDLITDNFVAVFELVKNAFDAHATEVKITFDNIYSENAQIVIEDNGKGMTQSDITSKWLFLGFSAKKDGTEDYRDKIQTGRLYAGAKGVGRFSCDRLGHSLELTTKSKAPGSKVERILVDWSKFDRNQATLFQKIPVKHESPKTTNLTIDHGTILKITGIRDDFWNRDNFKRLKERLSKLIRPDLNTNNGKQTFKIFLSVPDEQQNDTDELKKLPAENASAGEIEKYYSTVNGEIKNFVFQQLEIKTTKIEASIDGAGIITTRLTDRDNFIYEIKERSEYHLLKNINITLYFLNQSAKITFKKKTGVQHVDFGSLFVYKNGFRVYPYGERGDDSLRLENRALQGYARYIGLRSLIGEISIGLDNPQLKETTSRGDGLVKNKQYEQLTNVDDSFLIRTLRRLEKYVVDVTQWGVNSDDDTIDLTSKKAIEGLVKLVANISDKQTVDLKYNHDIINLIAAKEEKSAKKLVSNFKRIAAESNDNKLYKEAERIEKAISSSLKRAESAENERNQKVAEKRLIESELEIEKEKNVYLSSTRKVVSEDAEGLLHGIKFNLVEINGLVMKLLEDIAESNFSKKDIQKSLSEIKFFSEKTLKVAQLITRANYRQDQETLFIDVAQYIAEYLSIYNDIFPADSLEIKVTSSNAKLKKWASLLDITILLDNLISNSIKWKGGKNNKTKILVEMTNSHPGVLEILFHDNGVGLSDSLKKFPNKIFELGVTESANGSGIGLYTVKDILGRMGGNIEFIGNKLKLNGATFKIQIKK